MSTENNLKTLYENSIKILSDLIANNYGATPVLHYCKTVFLFCLLPHWGGGISRYYCLYVIFLLKS